MSSHQLLFVKKAVIGRSFKLSFPPKSSDIAVVTHSELPNQNESINNENSFSCDMEVR